MIISKLYQVETWLQDSYQFLKTTRGGARRCAIEKDFRELIDLIENFQFSGVEIQRLRLSHLLQLAVQLDYKDVKLRAQLLNESQEKINYRLQQLLNDMEGQIIKLKEFVSV